MAEIQEKITKPLISAQNPARLILGIASLAVILGILTGYILSTKNSNLGISPLSGGAPAKSAQQDTKTFRDFAQGVIKPKTQAKDPQDENGGTHLLIRDGAVPVTLTSSVVDLSKYEDKKVKVFGETQAVPGVEWFMDVGKVEEVK